MAGKNAPCGECRRILKVPLRVKADAKDWRTVAAKPALARQDTNQLEGAWGVGQAQAVSVEALKGADIGGGDDEAEPSGWVKRIAIVAGTLAIVGFIAVGVLWGINRRQRGKLERAMETALAYADPKHDPKSKYPKVKPEPSGLLLTLAAKHALSTNKPTEARDYLLAARSRFKGPTAEEHAALIDVACGLVDLAGTSEQIVQGKRLDFVKSVQKDVSATLMPLMTVSGDDGRDLRSYAFRRLTRHLVAADQIKAPIAIANYTVPPGDRSEIIAVIGLELLALSRRDAALDMAKAATVTTAADASSLIALWMALSDANAPEDVKKQATDGIKKVAPPGKDTGMTAAQRIGSAEGFARQGNPEKGRQLAAGAKAGDKLRARVALAAAASDTKPGDVTDLDECLKMLDGEMKGASPAPWLMMRLVEICTKVNRLDAASRAAAAMGDAGLRAWGQYEALQARLKATDQPAPPDWAKEVGTPDRLAHALALTAVARHNARISGGDGVFRDAEKWDKEELRPFGFAGVALAAVPD
jgi:hypothetical protein